MHAFGCSKGQFKVLGLLRVHKKCQNLTNMTISILTYMGIFGLVQTRGFCLDGVIRPLDPCVPLLPLLKGKVITSSFFYMCLPNGVGVKNVKGIKGVK